MTTAAAGAAAGFRIARQRNERVLNERAAFARAHEARHPREQGTALGRSGESYETVGRSDAYCAEKRREQDRYELLLSIPTRIIQANDSAVGADCAICLSQFAAGEKLKTLPCSGKHIFHSSCVRQCFQQQSCCPICREDTAQAT
jgi:hypothetical protein